MTPVMTRQDEERLFHDRQAGERLQSFLSRRSDLRFDDESYLEHASWIRPSLDSLGDVRGRRVLDLGCGHGMASVVLARRGAIVTGCDLSPGYIAEAKARASANQVEIAFEVADGEALPFPDGSFDAIWGNAILHHLDLRLAAAELKRLLRPGRRAVCCEPWGENPLLEFARKHLPYPAKQRTRDERPLTSNDLQPLREAFPEMAVEHHQLLSMLGRLRTAKRRSPVLEAVDRRLFQTLPALKKYSRYVVLTLPRP